MKKHVFLFIVTIGFSVFMLSSCQCVQHTQTVHVDPIVQDFSVLSTSSISDAIDKIIGTRGFMSHDMRPLFDTKMCGRAVTVLAKPSEKSEPPTMALELIDTEKPGKILVIVMDGQDGVDVAAFGGIMATGSQMRGFVGAVLDGGCRDAKQIEEMGFPVFTRGVVPSNSLGRYVNVSKNEPVNCGGVTVSPGDIVIGDYDGVAVVPKERALEILELARELEAKEAMTVESVKRMKSIQGASQKHDRI